MFAVAPSLFAAGLSKQDLIDLRSAGVDAPGIVRLINARGLSFSPTPKDLLDLKAVGFDATVINALAAADAKAPAPSGSSSQAALSPSAYRAAADLYRAGKYEEAISVLEPHLSTEPKDHVSRALIATTYLRLHKRDLASQELDGLRVFGSDRAAAPAASILQDLIASYDAQERLKEELKAALLGSRLDDASGLIDRMKLSDLSRRLLLIYLDLYRGEFSAARGALIDMKPIKYSDRKRIDELHTDVTSWEKTFTAAMKQIDAALFSGVAPSTWTSLGGPGQSPHFVEDYLKAVDTAVGLCPFHSSVRDLSFHSGLMTLDYDALEKLGDSILRAKGSIRVPGCSRDKYFYLVIDGRNRRLRTEVDNEHPFLVKADVGGAFSLSVKEDSATNKLINPLEPFDLAWAEIVAVEQRASGQHGSYGDVPYPPAKVLQLKPHGMMPEWSMMNAVHYLYGERVQKQCTQKLGKYVLHLLNSEGRNVKAELVDPSKSTSGNGALVLGAALAGAMTAAGAHYGNTGLQELGKQSLQDVQAAASQDAAARREAAQREQSWLAALTARSMHFFEDAAYGDIEKLLQLVN